MDVAAEAGETAVALDATAEANGIQPRWNLLESFKVGMLKLYMFLRLSGVTELINNSNVNIEFYTTTRDLESLRFHLKARRTKRIEMRKLFAFRVAHTAEVVMLKVGGEYVRLTFVPEDFVRYKRLVFDQNGMGELFCSDREVR